MLSTCRVFGKTAEAEVLLCKTRALSQSQPEACFTSSNTQKVTSSLKRSASFGEDKNKTVKRQKSAGAKSKADGQPKTNLLSFFKRSTAADMVAIDKNVTKVDNKAIDLVKTDHSEVVTCANANNGSLVSNTNNSSSTKSAKISDPAPVSESISRKDCSEKRKTDAALWKSILSGPRPPPLCSGHKEPCVLRTVKLKGTNQGKQFHCCARPQGHSSNPEARCSFFKWVK